MKLYSGDNEDYLSVTLDAILSAIEALISLNGACYGYWTLKTR